MSRIFHIKFIVENDAGYNQEQKRTNSGKTLNQKLSTNKIEAERQNLPKLYAALEKTRENERTKLKTKTKDFRPTKEPSARGAFPYIGYDPPGGGVFTEILFLKLSDDKSPL